MGRPRKNEDAPRPKVGPWISWVTAVRWTPAFSCVAAEKYEKTGSAEDREALVLEAAPEFVAFLAGRAYRLKYGPKPFVPEWSLDGDAPRAAKLGLYGGLGKDADRTLQAEWEEGWVAEHRRLRGGRLL